jgi:DNA-binding transcriptional MerR regulator
MDKSADAFRTISEVADELDLPQHVLRFWETRFPQIKPLKRAGGRRFYRPYDVEILRAIRRLLYGEGYTIKGVQRILKEHGARAVIAPGLNAPENESGIAPESAPSFSEELSPSDWGEDLFAPISLESPGDPNIESERSSPKASRMDAQPRHEGAAGAGAPARLEIVRQLSDILLELEACERMLEAARRS